MSLERVFITHGIFMYVRVCSMFCSHDAVRKNLPSTASTCINYGHHHMVIPASSDLFTTVSWRSQGSPSMAGISVRTIRQCPALSVWVAYRRRVNGGTFSDSVTCLHPLQSILPILLWKPPLMECVPHVFLYVSMIFPLKSLLSIRFAVVYHTQRGLPL